MSPSSVKLNHRTVTRSVMGVAMALCSGALAGHASAQALSFRSVAAALPFTPLHSYVAGELGEDLIFFGGISGQGLHTIAQASGLVAFPLSVYSDRIHLLDQTSGILYTGSTAHLSLALRNRLRISNAGEVQLGDALYIYGGYGPETATTWFTKASVLRVDLPTVAASLRANTPVPEGAFTIMPSAAAEVAGCTMVKLGATEFALIGGSNFRGDYGLGEANPQPFSNTYSDSVHIFDSAVSMTTPARTFTDNYWLHRRDLNALPVTMTGVAPRPGLALVCGVFNGPGPWETPATFALGDSGFTVHDTYIQKMNQYEAARASFFSASTGANRLALLGGLSYQIFIGGQFFYDFLVPWVTEITEQTFINGAFVEGGEKIVGQMTLPTTNTKLFLRPTMPQNVSGQVLLDMLPHNEHLLGRVVGGLSSAEPGPEPTTFASSNVYNVYVAVGVRGDVNKDGVVSFADLNIVLGQFGTSGPLFTLSGDLNLDGAVTFADLNVVLSNFGSNTPG